MKAELIFHEKRLVSHTKTEELAIVEIKVWKVPSSKDYPSGRKFSLFLVSNDKILAGVDNHKPKGPHRHTGNREVTYDYVNEERLLSDFWSWVKKEGFEL